MLGLPGNPISALAGREEIMRAIDTDRVPQGGTYAGHPVSLAAAAKTLEILEETDALERVGSYGRQLREALGAILTERGIPHVFVGHPSMGGLVFAEDAPRNVGEWAQSDYALYNELAAHINELGILCEPDSWEPWFISASHDDSCLTETAEKFELALDAALAARAPKASARG